MFNHAPEGYQCPICLAIKGVENEATMIKQADIIWRDEQIMVLLSSKFVGKHPGHVLVVPVEHYENIFDLPEDVGHRIFDVAKKVAVALKDVRKCEGVTTMQNNEPAGNQHAFHYHFHVFPRFEGDILHEEMGKSRVSEPEERGQYVVPLKEYFKKHQ